MSTLNLLAVFNDIDPAAEAIDKLHELGVNDEDINVISGVPIAHKMLGRPHPWTNVPKLSLGGAIAGFFFGLFLNFGTPNMYTVLVGGQYITPIPPGLIVTFEMTMLFALLATFLGVFLDSDFPNFSPMDYVPEVSDGKIAIFFHCEKSDQKKFTETLKKLGAESIKPAEAQQL